MPNIDQYKKLKVFLLFGGVILAFVSLFVLSMWGKDGNSTISNNSSFTEDFTERDIKIQKEPCENDPSKIAKKDPPSNRCVKVDTSSEKAKQVQISAQYSDTDPLSDKRNEDQPSAILLDAKKTQNRLHQEESLKVFAGKIPLLDHPSLRKFSECPSENNLFCEAHFKYFNILTGILQAEIMSNHDKAELDAAFKKPANFYLNP